MYVSWKGANAYLSTSTSSKAPVCPSLHASAMTAAISIPVVPHGGAPPRLNRTPYERRSLRIASRKIIIITIYGFDSPAVCVRGWFHNIEEETPRNHPRRNLIDCWESLSPSGYAVRSQQPGPKASLAIPRSSTGGRDDQAFRVSLMFSGRRTSHDSLLFLIEYWYLLARVKKKISSTTSSVIRLASSCHSGVRKLHTHHTRAC